MFIKKYLCATHGLMRYFDLKMQKSEIQDFFGKCPKLRGPRTGQKIIFGPKSFGFVLLVIKWSQYHEKKKFGGGHFRDLGDSYRKWLLNVSKNVVVLLVLIEEKNIEA